MNLKKPEGPVIADVTAGSPAEQAGIKAGWRLIRIDNQPPGDIINYRILESDDRISLLLLTDRGILRRVKIVKPPGKPLGLRFDPPTIGPMQCCGNKCIFCFVDQNPCGMRPALYDKDDDYRLSFLYGNFITLNRVTSSELNRISALQLSPLYVSVHTTNPDLRSYMFGTKRAVKGLANLRRLAEKGIRIHAQVVLIPDINTGPEMERTIADLDEMGPSLASVALVPVGLTAHRDELPAIRKFTAAEAAALLGRLDELQQQFLSRRGSRFVFASDEFYNLASAPVPEDDHYEGYPQLENGVGLARHFLDELAAVENKAAAALKSDLKITIVAAPAAESLLLALKEVFSRSKGLTVDLRITGNSFFGDEVTVSGLLTGRDLLAVFEGNPPGHVVFITRTMLKDKSDLFLDDLSVEEVENVLGAAVCAVDGPLELLSKIREIDADPSLYSKGAGNIER